MSERDEATGAGGEGRSWSATLFLAGVLVLFGFLAFVLAGFAGRESPEDRAFRGDFDEETVARRWATLEEVSAAQDELLDPERVSAALADLAASPPEPAATQVVVPGSPTFMKQQEQAEESEEEKPEEKAEEEEAEEEKAEEEKAEEEAEEEKAETPEQKEPKEPAADNP